MSDNEKNKLLMYETVITYLHENKDIISKYNTFSVAISKLKEAVDEIKIKDRELNSNVLRNIIFVENAKEDLIFTVIPVVSSIYNYAKEINNIELKEKTRLNQSRYTRLRNIELVEQSLKIIHIAEKYLPELVKYGITRNSIQTLNTRFLIFKNALNTLNNKLIKVAFSSNNLSLVDQFTTAENILINEIDKLIEPFNLEKEEFYNDYLSIRSVKYFEEDAEQEYSIEEEVEK